MTDKADSRCVAEIMKTDLFTLTPDTVVGSAQRLASKKKVSHFLVIDKGNLTGIVSRGTLLKTRADSLVGACMATPVLCIGPETTVTDAADIMEENEIGCLPVVTGAFLVGIVTRRLISGEEEEAAEPLDGAVSTGN